ncbi:MAG TPA: hypothetical protein VH476_02190 [Solirubrobacterales bacterium]
MSRVPRFAKPAAALIAAAAVVLAVSGCAFLKPNSLALTQPQGTGPVRVHFNLCTLGGSGFCGPNEDEESLQYVAGIAVPPGSVPPASFTAVPVGGGTPIAFTRDDEVVPEMTAAAAAIQKFLGEAETPEEIKEAEELRPFLGGPWPPSGLQGVGYISAPVQELEGVAAEWSVDADFGLPTPADGGPFAGPFATSVAIGFREVTATEPASRPLHCARFEALPQEGEAFCSGSLQQAQIGTADLRIAAPAKPAQAFVGGSAQLAFPLKFGGAPTTPPTFALSATTTVKGGKTKLGSGSFTPGPANPTGNVTVSVPNSAKPGTYSVTLTAATFQGSTATQVGKLKVTKPKLKFAGVQLNAGKGTATLKVKVPGAGRLTITGKGVAKVKKKANKAKTLKVKIKTTGGTSDQLGNAGSVKVKVKATFKPSSGISVSKTKSIVLKQH